MQTPSLTSALVSVSLALLSACGGGKGTTAPQSPGGEGDDPATPFNDRALKATLASAPGSAECGVAPGITMGDHFQARKQALRGDGIVVEESFRCRARADDRWDCEWSVSGVPDEAAPADEAALATESQAAFTILATVRPDGSVDPTAIRCAAPR